MEIPGYRIERQIGAGGMATVHLAVHEALEREVALKVMTPSLASDETYCRRFLKEGKIAAKLNHRHVLTVFDIGRHGDHFYIASEYVPDGTLRDRINRGIDASETVRVIDELAQGLSYAHAHGFVHRDVKPGNVLFRKDGSCVLGDFGIAKSVNSNTFATKLGTSLGTPYYMSPEQARGERVDNRTDLYSLGVVLYECLTGEPPYDADDPFTVALMQINEPVPTLPSEHSRFQPLIDKLMAKEADYRFFDAEQFLAALRRTDGKEQVVAAQRDVRRWLPVAGLAGALLIGGAIAYFAAGPDDQDTASDSSLATEESDEAAVVATPTPGPSPIEALLVDAQRLVSQQKLLPPGEPNAYAVLKQAEAIDPDSRAVEIALREVANTVESDAEALLRAGRQDPARSLVCAGLDVFPDRAGLSYLADQFELACATAQESGSQPDAAESTLDAEVAAQVAALIADGDRFMALDVLAFPAGENAMDKYLAVVSLQPENAYAREKLEEIADIWADTAEYEMRRGRSESALNTVELGLRANPSSSRLLGLRSQLVPTTE